MSRWRRLDAGRIAILAVLVIGTAAFLTRDRWLSDGPLEAAIEDSAGSVASNDEPSDQPAVREVAAAPLVDVEDPARTTVGTTSDIAGEIEAAEFAAGAFGASVQPILESRCVSCHTPGGPGWSALALDTAADAADMAADIAFVTAINYMPPWLPSDLSPQFVHDWSLSDAEKAAIAAWAETGGGLDVAPDTPLIARVQAIIGVQEDQKIGPRDGLYTGYSQPDGSPVKKDDYRCY